MIAHETVGTRKADESKAIMDFYHFIPLLLCSSIYSKTVPFFTLQGQLGFFNTRLVHIPKIKAERRRMFLLTFKASNFIFLIVHLRYPFSGECNSEEARLPHLRMKHGWPRSEPVVGALWL